MSRLDLDFESVDADVDESTGADESPPETARRLALAKARAVHADHRSSFVIGADQTIDLDGTRFDKPGTADAAVDQLRQLAGQTHRLTCAAALVDPERRTYEQSVEFQMTMRDLSDHAIRRYVDRDHPVECAGAYKIEQGGIQLFRSMDGDDYTAIIGLPLTRIWNILEAADYFSNRQASE